MSLPDTDKSDTDISSNPSWSVIGETDDSRQDSLQNIVIQRDIDNTHGSDEENRASDIDSSFITIPEDAAWTIDPNDHVPPARKLKKNKSKKIYSESLSIATIIASILTITGITILCMLFPQDIDTQSHEQVHKAYVEVVSRTDETIPEVINKTSEVLKVVAETNLLDKIHDRLECDDGGECSKEDDICPADGDATGSDTDHDGLEHFPGKREKKGSWKKTRSKLTPKKSKKQDGVSNNTKESTKTEITSHPQKVNEVNNVTKLVEQTSSVNARSQSNAVNNKTSSLNTYKKVMYRQTKDLVKETNELLVSTMNETSNRPQSAPFSNKKVTKKVDPTKEPALDLIRLMTNGTERHQEIEELRKRWECAGNDYRRRIDLIKQEFRDEVMPTRYIDFSQRSQKIRMIRQKYVAFLKMHRERYLAQLRRYREDKQKLIDEICLRVQESTNQKDASVGNYAVLLDGYDFRQTLKNLACNEGSSGITHMENLMSIRDTAEDPVKYQSADHKLSEIGSASRSQNLNVMANYSNKLHSGSKTSLKKKPSDKNNEKLAQVVECPLVEEVVGNMMSNLSQLSTSFSNLNNRISKSNAMLDSGFAEQTGSNSKIEENSNDSSSGQQNKESIIQIRNEHLKKGDTWLESEEPHSIDKSSLGKKTKELDTKKSLANQKITIKTPTEMLKEDLNNNNNIDAKKDTDDAEIEEGKKDGDNLKAQRWRYKTPSELSEEHIKNGHLDNCGARNRLVVPTKWRERMSIIRMCNEDYKKGDTLLESEVSNKKGTSEEDTADEDLPQGQFKVVTKREGRKRDIYEAAFDENGQKIKEKEITKWGLQKRMRSPQSFVFSKQDPKTVVKEKFSFKGQL
ncbi:unnamed protein product [Acanthoscelides obtectus]|uniref:Uncharacterized protein n=1 Tax=Acanthoscelides obtectus TaxID=200917 RepID=A0A9P0KPG4_ACAOB|nr:unnamed protein product [Acanthoscelides obtectus]CAK1646447.1 hypothetical protein AOBTE_LOCUS14637 [Acanthoscelides obtectus]